MAERWSRRRLAGALAGAGALLGLAGCSVNSGAKPTAAAPTLTPTQPPIGSPVASYQNRQRWLGRTLTIASLGGSYQDAQRETLFKPFAAATGAQVAERGQSSDLGALRAQVDRQTVTWDVACVAAEDVRGLARGGYLRPIDYQVVDRTALLAADRLALQYSIAADLFSTVIAYPPKSRQPTGWRDFWDEATFPGGRALKKDPRGTLEFALLADGVPPDKLYPLDIPRAFASLDRIKPKVLLWWEDGKQPAELVAEGQILFASTWNVRADLPELRPLVGLQWYGGMLSADFWVVPKGAPNADVAMDFINYATRAVPQANFARLVPFGPVNPDAFQYLRTDRLPELPSADVHFGVQFMENWNYWDDNLTELSERFAAWLETAPAATATATARPT